MTTPKNSVFLILKTDIFVKNIKETQNKFFIKPFIRIKKYLCSQTLLNSTEMMKILKNLLLFFSITTAVIYFTSCEKYSYLVEPPTIDTTKIIYYSKDIQPIFDAKCVSCHRGALAPDLRPDNSYEALSKGGFLTLPAENSKLYDYVINRTSHISYTNQEEKGIIYSWLLQGAEDIEEPEDN